MTDHEKIDAILRLSNGLEYDILVDRSMLEPLTDGPPLLSVLFFGPNNSMWMHSFRLASDTDALPLLYDDMSVMPKCGCYFCRDGAKYDQWTN